MTLEAELVYDPWPLGITQMLLVMALIGNEELYLWLTMESGMELHLWSPLTLQDEWLSGDSLLI